MNIPRVFLLASLLACCALPAQALQQVQSTQQVPDKSMPVDAALAGEYSLAGVMETGLGRLTELSRGLVNRGPETWLSHPSIMD